MSEPAVAHPWLDEMPPAPCPEGCVVRRGGLLGVVVWNRDGDWSVQYLAPNRRLAARGEEGQPGDGGPEAAGWRHALDRHEGFCRVWLMIRGIYGGWLEIAAEFGSAIGCREESLEAYLMAGKADDEDRLKLARAFAAVLR